MAQETKGLAMKKLCPFGGKVSFETKEAAKFSRERIKKNMRIYKCKNCYKWHLTSRLD